MNALSPLLEISQLRAGYGEAEVLHGIDLSVSQGEFVCIIGANTAGKSTILRSISRLVPKSSGTMRFGGADLTVLAAHEIPALGIAHVPEGRQVFPDMTVEENLLLGAFTARKAGDLPARIEEVFELFPRLRERYGQLAGTLSGGEQQMVAVGRALMLRQSCCCSMNPATASRQKWSRKCIRRSRPSTKAAPRSCWSSRMSNTRLTSPAGAMSWKPAS